MRYQSISLVLGRVCAFEVRKESNIYSEFHQFQSCNSTCPMSRSFKITRTPLKGSSWSFKTYKILLDSSNEKLQLYNFIELPLLTSLCLLFSH